MLAQNARAPEVLLSKKGISVDVSGYVWSISEPGNKRVLIWNKSGLRGNALSGVCRYGKWLLKNRSSQTLLTSYYCIAAYGLFCQKANVDPLSLHGLATYRTHILSIGNLSAVERVRQWYRWCTNAEHEEFDPDVLFAVERWSVARQKSYLPVRTADSKRGPLSPQHDKMLQTAIWAANDCDAQGAPRYAMYLTFRQVRAMVAICRFLGCRPEQVRYLNEGDLQVYRDGENAITAVLYVPRCKNHLAPRKERVKRKITIELADLLKGAMEDNAHLEFPARTKPMFCRVEPHCPQDGNLNVDCWRPFGLASPFRSWAKGVGLSGNSNECKSSAHPDGITGSERFNGDGVVDVYPRRLRYTFATEHAVTRSPIELAYMLDHTSAESIKYYYTYADDILNRLSTIDEATGWGMIARSFLGYVKEQTEDVPLGKAIYIPSEQIEKYGDLVGLGRCGMDRLCQLFPLFSCYDCARFEPDPDGPHENILADLIEWRNRWPKSVGRSRDNISVQLDNIIGALGHLTVVLRVYRHLRAIRQKGQAIPDLDKTAAVTGVPREFIDQDRSIQMYISQWSKKNAPSSSWVRRQRGKK